MSDLCLNFQLKPVPKPNYSNIIQKYNEIKKKMHRYLLLEYGDFQYLLPGNGSKSHKAKITQRQFLQVKFLHEGKKNQKKVKQKKKRKYFNKKSY